MAFGAKAIIIVRPSGDDTNNGGGFNLGNANFATDLTTDANTANTSAPVVSSASYNFVAGDSGKYLFIQAGTSWLPGLYPIASVASNKATLNAAIGAAVLYDGTQLSGLNTAVGCATVGTPTSGTWGVDYSNADAARITFTDILGVGTTFTSVLNPVGKNFIGNYISVTSGTNYTVQRVEVVSTSTITATVDKTFGASATGNGGGRLGGALASPGKAGGLAIGGNDVFIRSGTYSITSASSNVASGVVSIPAAGTISNFSRWEGFGTIPRDWGTRPLLQASGISTTNLFTIGATNGAYSYTGNLSIDCAGLSSLYGIQGSNAKSQIDYVKVANGASGGFGCTAGLYTRCEATGTSVTAGFSIIAGMFIGCEAYGNTVPGFSSTGLAHFIDCIASGNTGATSDGFITGGSPNSFVNCTSYGNGQHGFNLGGNSSANTGAQTCISCLSEGNTGWGFTSSATVNEMAQLLNCGTYNNTLGAVNTTQITMPATGFVTNTTGTFFTNAGSGDFSLNATANQGALARGAGWGAFPRGTSVGHADMGAVQHADPAAGGGGAVIGSSVIQGGPI